jgi:hypothetical protein
MSMADRLRVVTTFRNKHQTYSFFKEGSSAVTESGKKDSKYCYNRAFAAKERVSQTTNPPIREFYRDLELQWLRLGASYEHIEQLSTFVTELRSLPRRPLCAICDGPMRPNGLQVRPDGVTEYLYRCGPCDFQKTLIRHDG